MNSPIRYTEHSRFSLGEYPELKEMCMRILEECKPTEVLQDIRLLGMDYDFHAKDFYMGYYVGADWIDRQSEQALLITPKIKDIDFQEMFMYCFKHEVANFNLEQLFFIRTEDKPIKISSSDFEIEPLIIIYFLNLVASLVKKGLKKDYVMREENLNGKIKGKILYSNHIKRNIAHLRNDKIYCRYQEYDVDCIDNRILKKALLLSQSMIDRNRRALGDKALILKNLLNISLPAFEGVSSNVSLYELNHLHFNPVYKQYRQALTIAKMIIQKDGYCVQRNTIESEQYFPPFIINMPLLFERYVYSLLIDRYDKKQIGFQVATYGNIMDFCKYDEHMVLDTKYIPGWEDGVDHENVRQLSGYARNKRLREKLGIQDDATILPCTIIYPSKNGSENLMSFGDTLFLDTKLQDISEYVKFKRLGIKLPTKQVVG